MATIRKAFDVRAGGRLLACVVLLAGSLIAITGHRSAAGFPAASPELEPLLLFDEATDKLHWVVPTTLESFSDRAPLALGADVSPWDIAVSADGSTLVHTDRNGSRAYTVRDGATGAVRATPDAGNWIVSPVLSADGTRLLANLMTDRLVWALIETATGKLLSTFTPSEGWVDPVATNADLTRLYYLTIPTNAPQTGQAPSLTPELVAVDLTTGAEAGRVLLPDVVAGAEMLEDEPGGANEPMYHFRRPGLAVSPDGSRIAVVRADRSGFTLVDAARLTIESSVAVTREEGLAHRFLRWLAILPQSAAAKMGTGDMIFADFSPDGARLYVWGYHDEPEPEESRVVATGLGLMILDAATGEVLAEGLEGQLVERLAVSPDGSALAVAGPTSGTRLSAWVSDADLSEFDSPYELQVLDAATLDVLAGRAYSGLLWFAFGR